MYTVSKKNVNQYKLKQIKNKIVEHAKALHHKIKTKK